MTTFAAPTAVARSRRRSFLRDCCVAMLRRYFNACAEIGRLPSLLGREFFAARQASRHRPMAFEQSVIFTIDIERCLDQLDDFDRDLVARIVLQEHSEEDAARLLHCCRETISRRLPAALDQLADLFVDRELLVIRHQPPLEEPESDTVSLNASAAALYPPVSLGEIAPEHRQMPVEICCQAPLPPSIHASV